jgi:hypothetical protein
MGHRGPCSEGYSCVRRIPYPYIRYLRNSRWCSRYEDHLDDDDNDDDNDDDDDDDEPLVLYQETYH